MRQATVSVLLLLLLSACAIGNKYDYGAARPELLAKSSGTVAVGVHDKRPYVVSNDKQPSFVGLQRGGYGNPFDVTTLSGQALADDFSQVIVDALEKNGIAASTVLLSPQDRRKTALQALVDSGVERAIFVTVDEWKSDNFINVALIYNLSAEVLDGRGNVLAETRQQGRDALGAGVGFDLSTAVGGLVVEGSRRVLNALLNDEQIVAALVSGPVASKVAKAPIKSTESDAASTRRDLTSDPDRANPDSSPKAPATTTHDAQSPERETSNAERDRVTQFIRNNENKVKLRLASYNASNRIGANNNSSRFKVLTIDNILVRKVDGDRATVELGFASGPRTFPNHHEYLYDLQISAGDIVFLGHHSSNNPLPDPEAASRTADSVSPSDRIRIERYFDAQNTRARASLRRYNQKHNIGQGGFYDDHRIRLIDSVEVIAVGDQGFKVKIGLTVGNTWGSTYFAYLYTVRLVGNDLQVLAHREL